MRATATLFLAPVWLLVIALGCQSGSSTNPPNNEANIPISTLAGSIVIEGSSTVEPISIKAKEEFNRRHPRVNISVIGKGTGNGLAALINGEADIADCSRPIKLQELEDCRKAGIEFYEIPIAYDGLTIVVNRANSFTNQMTLTQLAKVFGEDNAARSWNEVDANWPDEPISVYAAGIASGTHDYLVQMIAEKDNRGLRSDERTILSEDDKLLVRGIKEDPFSIGFFGYAYYLPEMETLRAVLIVNQKGKAVEPSSDTIASGEYPLSRPLFLYVNADSYRRSEVKEFVDLYIEQAPSIVANAGYIPLPEQYYLSALDKLEGPRERGIGTLFLDDSGKHRNETLKEVYQHQKQLD